jgi:GNAT superfamily N-acetyltransferase
VELGNAVVRMRPLEPGDAALVREYVRLSIYVAPGAPPLPRDIVDRPAIARYVDAWGRHGDDGLVAVDHGSGDDVGAAWLRLWTPPEVGYGFVDAETPELGVAVREPHRGRGIGTALVRALLARAARAHAKVSLSVSTDNPAVRLYERLGFAVVARAGSSLTMCVRLVVAIVTCVTLAPVVAGAEACRAQAGSRTTDVTAASGARSMRAPTAPCSRWWAR